MEILILRVTASVRVQRGQSPGELQYLGGLRFGTFGKMPSVDFFASASPGQRLQVYNLRLANGDARKRLLPLQAEPVRTMAYELIDRAVQRAGEAITTQLQRNLLEAALVDVKLRQPLSLGSTIYRFVLSHDLTEAGALPCFHAARRILCGEYPQPNLTKVMRIH